MLMIKENIYRILFVLILGFAVFASAFFFVRYWPANAAGKSQQITVERAKRTKLVVVTRNDLQGYYSYQDEPQGFEYELAKAFADYKGLELQIVAVADWEDMHEALLDGRADIIAGIAATAPHCDRFIFSNSYLTVRQVPVTNKNAPPIRSLEDLTGRSIFVPLNSAHQTRLNAMLAQGFNLNPVFYRDKTTDDLVRGVAEGEYDVTMTYDYIAMAYTRHYPNINIGVVLNEDLELAWAMRPDDKELLADVNEFFAAMQADNALEKLYNRYFGINHDQNYNELEVFHRKIHRNMPTYLTAIRNSAYQHGFDWRLIAAIIYQESQFNPNAVSFYGASGLMQLMPNTAASLGLPRENIYDPGKNIAAGVKYLKRMYDIFDEVPDETERLKLALASYNAGIGHVLDARKLAEDQNLDKDAWDSIGPMLVLLTKKEYYSQVKYGYCNGKETNSYVNNVMTYYDILKYKGSNFNMSLDLSSEPEALQATPNVETPNTLATN